MSVKPTEHGHSGRRSTCAIIFGMTTVGLRELRQDASDLVRRVENGEEIEITVAGRLAARLVPAAPRRWQRWVDIADLFTGRPDPEAVKPPETVPHIANSRTRLSRAPPKFWRFRRPGSNQAGSASR